MTRLLQWPDHLFPANQISGLASSYATEQWKICKQQTARCITENNCSGVLLLWCWLKTHSWLVWFKDKGSVIASSLALSSSVIVRTGVFVCAVSLCAVCMRWCARLSSRGCCRSFHSRQLLNMKIKEGDREGGGGSGRNEWGEAAGRQWNGRRGVGECG